MPHDEKKPRVEMVPPGTTFIQAFHKFFPGYDPFDFMIRLKEDPYQHLSSDELIPFDKTLSISSRKYSDGKKLYPIEVKVDVTAMCVNPARPAPAVTPKIHAPRKREEKSMQTFEYEVRTIGEKDVITSVGPTKKVVAKTPEDAVIRAAILESKEEGGFDPDKQKIAVRPFDR